MQIRNGTVEIPHVNGLVVPNYEDEDPDLLCAVDFTDRQTDIFEKLLYNNRSPEEIMPADIDPAELWEYFNAAGKGYGAAEQSLRRLTPLLGRALLLIRQHSHLYKQYGFTSFSDFMARGMKEIGVSRDKAFKCLSIAESMSHVSTSILEKIGVEKAAAIARAVATQVPRDSPIEMSRNATNQWVAIAQTQGMTVAKLKTEIETQQMREAGDLTRVPHTLYLTKPVSEMLTEFLENAKIEAFVGSKDQSVKVEHALQECRSGWLAQFEDQNRAGGDR